MFDWIGCDFETAHCLSEPVLFLHDCWRDITTQENRAVVVAGYHVQVCVAVPVGEVHPGRVAIKEAVRIWRHQIDEVCENRIGIRAHVLVEPDRTVPLAQNQVLFSVMVKVQGDRYGPIIPERASVA